MADPILSFFTSMDHQGVVIVRDSPKLDLEQYMSNYKGRTRFERLFLIGRSSVPLCVDALKAAVVEAKKGKDVQRYRDVWECIHVAAPGEPEAKFDQGWADRVESANREETSDLEAQLRGYKNNLIKESIRIGHRDLGQYLENIGDLNAAAEAYIKMRPDASTSLHIVDASKHLISIQIQKRDWNGALANVNKIHASNLSDDETKVQLPYQKIVAGLAHLGLDKYYDAAKSFLEVSEPAVIQNFNDIISPNDIATYGGLLALASMGRQELQSRVLDSSTFRSFLELESHIRKAITMFINGRYSACLAILESYRSDYLLDIYLQPHVSAIYSMIRSKCIVQYFAPFSCVTLENLNSAFSRPGERLEEELATMIRSGALKARINTIDKLLVAVSTDARVAMQSKGLTAARAYEKEALERIRRMSIAAADLEVKATKKGGMLPGLGDTTWYDDSRRPMNPGESTAA